MNTGKIRGIIENVIGETRKVRSVAIINPDGYVRWRRYRWGDDAWEAFKESMEEKTGVRTETDYSGDILLIFKTEGGKGSGE